MNMNPTETEIKYIRESLDRFNNEHVGDDGHTPLHIAAYDDDGRIIGGILGGTYWGWMYIDILWVHENHRRRGLGSELLQKAEEEALQRSCHHVHVDGRHPRFIKRTGMKSLVSFPIFPKGIRNTCL